MGQEGFLNTLDVLREKNLHVIGAGRDISEARRPALLNVKNTKIAFLGYNSIVAPGSEAQVDKPGCAPVRVSTTYEQVDWQPGTPPRIITVAHKQDLAAMIEDIRTAKQQADLVLVSFHWGVHLIPAVIATYQYEVGHAAIDAGADLILGHHPHILKGIEVYKGKPIFFSIGNFAFESWTGHASPEGKALYKVKPDPEYPSYLFSPECRMTMLLKIIISDRKLDRVSFLPALVNKAGQTELLTGDDKKINEVRDYVEWACRDQNLDTAFRREGNEVVVLT